SFAYAGTYTCQVNASSNAGSPQGYITYSYDGGTPVPITLGGGSAQFTIHWPQVGSHTVIIAYPAQTNFAAPASLTESFTVTPAQVNVALTPSSWTTHPNATLTLLAAITSSSAPVPHSAGTVSFYDGANLLATVPVTVNGDASFSTNTLTKGT